ncbi:MAG TPA: helix-turn-helix transcriptional regulator [Bacilli bacterium]
MEIVKLVKAHEPITGEQISEMLGVGRTTIRSDLAILVMIGLLDAKPKVGYFLGESAEAGSRVSEALTGLKVKDVQSSPVIVRETASVHDAVVSLFIEDVGSLIVTDADGKLSGIVSRKDLLKMTVANPNAANTPISLAMTRMPNVITVTPEDPVVEAARKIMLHQVDCLPVCKQSGEGEGLEVVGRITKTTLVKLLLRLANVAM